MNSLFFVLVGCVWTVWVQPILGQDWGNGEPWGQLSAPGGSLSGYGVMWPLSMTYYFSWATFCPLSSDIT